MIFQFLYRHSKGYRLLICLAIALTLPVVGLDTLVTYMTKVLIDTVVSQTNGNYGPMGGLMDWVTGYFDRFGNFASPADLTTNHLHTVTGQTLATVVVGLGLSLIEFLVIYVQMLAAAYVGQNISARLRMTTFDHVQRLSLDWHGQQKVGDIVQRISVNIADIEKLVTDGLVDFLTGSLTIIALLVLMFRLSFPLTIMSIFFVPLLFATVLFYTRIIKAANKKRAKAAGRLADVATEDLSAIAELKAFVLEEREKTRFQRCVERMYLTGFLAGRRTSEFMLLVGVITTIATALVNIVGYYVLSGHNFALGPFSIVQTSISLGTVTVFFVIQKRMYQPMRDLAKLTNLVSAANSAAERIHEVLKQDQEVRESRSKRVVPDRVKGDIRFDQVVFGYLPDQPVLHGITLDIPAGKRVALVGLSGAGKTTLVKLIPRFHEVWGGSVRIDGIDARDFPLDTLRQNMSLVLDDAVLFEGTVRENIELGRPGASDDEIKAAAQQAQIHETIMRLPLSYQSMVREGGKNFSAGQRQRLAIARAILRDAPILILDEPTASLDVEAESEVMHAVDTLIVGRTVFMISHRLSTLGHVDEIIVLEEGRIVERGTFQQLKHRDGVFRRMLVEQNRYTIDHDDDGIAGLPVLATSAMALNSASSDGNQTVESHHVPLDIQPFHHVPARLESTISGLVDEDNGTLTAVLGQLRVTVKAVRYASTPTGGEIQLLLVIGDHQSVMSFPMDGIPADLRSAFEHLR